MESKDQIQELATAFAKYIPILAGTAGLKNARFLTGTVTSVDENNRTCFVEGILDNEAIIYEDVNLSMERNDGFIQIPAIDSTVFVAITPDGESYVIHCSDIDKVICYIDSGNKFEFDSSGFIFNGGTLDGMVKVNSLVTKLNNIETLLNNILTAINTTWVPVVNDGGAALKALFVSLVATTLAPLTTTVKANIENPKIKQ